jgi:hypothetical protein
MAPIEDGSADAGRAANVVRGVAFLDERWPDWWRTDGADQIDVDRLHMEDGRWCVLAQASHRARGPGEYYTAVMALGLTSEQACLLGFNAFGLGTIAQLRELTERWRAVITERRSPDAA